MEMKVGITDANVPQLQKKALFLILCFYSACVLCVRQPVKFEVYTLIFLISSSVTRIRYECEDIHSWYSLRMGRMDGAGGR